jgi:hypothetical protein
MPHARPILALHLTALLTTALSVLLAAVPASAGLTLLESTPTRIVVEATFPAPTVAPVTSEGVRYDALSIPGTHPFGAPGTPRLAVEGTLLAIPGTAGPRLTVLEREYVELTGLRLPPVQASPDTRTAPSEEAYAADAFSPASFAAIGEPAIMRDLRVIPLRVYPVSYNPAAMTARVLTRIVVEIDLTSPGEKNLLTGRRTLSSAFVQTYADQVLNFEPSRYESDERGKYLIITHDTFYPTIQPLAEWKHLRGREVEVAKLSVIGSTASAIKSYIQDAYDTWDVPPDYILLVGDTDYLPIGSSYTDDYYATLAGSDYLVDVHLGRFSADSVADCELLVAKTLGYRRTPYMGDTDWFKSACLVIRNDYDDSDTTYYNDTWHAYELMDRAGFVVIDTLFSVHGADGSDWIDSIDEGRTILNYRGQGVSNYWSPFDIYPTSLNNGYMLPILMSATCGTGNFNSDGYPCETWMRAGTVASPKGAVAFLGTSEIVTHGAHLRSIVNQYFYTKLFQTEPGTVAECLNQGRYRVYAVYGDQEEYEGWNCSGDPELSVWTATPRMIDVTHDPIVPTGVSTYTVSVEHEGAPLRGAAVCVYAENEAYEAAITSSTGEVSFTLDLANADTLRVTVTGTNMYPYEGSAVVTPDGPFLTYESHTASDAAGGNGDGLLSPGETVELSLTLENVGPDDATGVTGVLRSGDAAAVPADSTASYGTIIASGTGVNADPLTFSVSTDAADGDALELEFVATDGARGTWSIDVPGVTVAAADLALLSVVIDDPAPGGDGDAALEAGETAWVEVTIENGGTIGLTGVTGTLTSADPLVAVSDAFGSFDAIGSGASASNGDDRFRVSVSSSAPQGYTAELDLELNGAAPTYTHTQTLIVTLPVSGNITTGPDAYGYFAYDSGDIWSGQAPAYSWTDIAPPGPGSIISAITNQDAATTTLSLPFTFTYYGTDYTNVSVCSNGFVALGTETYRFGDNSQIPNTHGPDAMIAPFWDDLDPSDGGDIYEWYDSTNHRWIVQFDANVHWGGGNPETFQVVLYDPAYHPTATGDGEIVFQYETVSSASSMTAGIENPAQTTGIQYLYNSTYAQAAEPIAAGQAILFTTEPPSSPPVWLVLRDVTVDDSVGGDGDGIAEPSESVLLVLDIENLGAGAATSVCAVVSSSSSDITITDDTACCASIASLSTVTLDDDPIALTIAASPDSGVVELELHLSSSDSRYDTWDVITLTLDTTQTGIEGIEPRFALAQNAPNPFSTGTRIAFQLPAPTDAELVVYNIAGRRVATLLSGELPGGPHTMEWNGTDDAGRRMASGIYFYRLTAGSHTDARKMILLK